MLRTLCLTLASAILVSAANARPFKNQYVRFDIPPGWDCSLAGAEWVCQSNDPAVRKEVIVICAAKPRSPEDELTKYGEYLKKPRAKSDLAGKPYTTEVKWVTTSEIRGQQWIDSLQFGSEIPGFYTRYMATVKGRVAMLITWTVSKSAYQKYSSEMKNFVASLEAFDDASGAVASNSAVDTSHPLGDEGGAGILGNTAGDRKTASANADDRLKMIVGGVVLAGALAALIAIRVKKKRRRG